MKCALFGDASKKIGDFKSKLGFLEKRFNEKVWDGTSLIAHQILENQSQCPFSPRECIRSHACLLLLITPDDEETHQEALNRVDRNAQSMREDQSQYSFRHRPLDVYLCLLFAVMYSSGAGCDIYGARRVLVRIR